MTPRYLLLAGAAAGDPHELVRQVACRTGLETAFSSAQIIALADPGMGCLALDHSGCVVGTLFHRHGPARPVRALDATDVRTVVESGGDCLFSAYWGGWVAAIAGAASVRILRDPSAALPCYFAGGDGFAAFASDAALLVEAGLIEPEVDREALGRHFLGGGVPVAETALRGISELLPGFSVRCPGGMGDQQACWSPWDHVHPLGEPVELAVERLSRAVRKSVLGWAGCHGRLLLSLSGGLDSSIVASVLAEARPDTVCLNMYGEDPSGDERSYARLVAERLGLPLVERAFRLEDIDICEPLGSRQPRPKDRTQALAYERAHVAVAGEAGATAFVTGNGGDSVFGFSQSAAPVADRLLSDGLGRGVLRALRDVSVQTGCGMLEATRAAVRIARGPRGYRCRPNPLLLDPDLVAGLGAAAPSHPWLEAPPWALPGKAAHVASILRVQQCFEPDRGRFLPVLSPLMSQPVVETCLAVPSWEWRAGGRDRALARRAFAASLPGEILRRRVKSGPDGFAAEILDRLRRPIAERLLYGWLARNRIVDRDALAEVLADQRPCSGEHRVRILELLAAEAWLDSWLVRASATPAAAS